MSDTAKSVMKKYDTIIKECSQDLFPVESIQKKKWGYDLYISVPKGYAVSDAEKFIGALEIGFYAIVNMNYDNFKKWVNVKIITKDFKDKVYKPIELPANKIFVGYDIYGEAITVDMNKFPHPIIAGATGSGKSRLIFMILTNLLYNANCDIWLTQIRKKDFSKFRPYVLNYADTEETACILFHQAVKEIEKRINYLDKNNLENIEECPDMKPLYIFGDEFSFYMPDKTDSKKLKMEKALCINYIKEIVKTGRSVGVFLIACLQRTTQDELLPTVKSQMRCKICFSMTSANNSENLLGTDEAFMLPNRHFILLTNKSQIIRTPDIDKNIIDKYLKPVKKSDIIVEAEFKQNDEIIKPKPKKTPTKNKRRGEVEC